MPQERARQLQDETRDAGTASARDALEHPHILFRFQRDPLDVAMRTGFDPAGAKSAARPQVKPRAK